MKIFYFFLLGLTVALCDDQQASFATANNGFTVDVYKEVKKVNSGNFLVCPISAEIILALTRIGARGETGRQLSKGLHLSNDVDQIEKLFKQITPTLTSKDGYTLTSANKVYIKDGYKIKDEFKSVARNSFLAEIENIDFAKRNAAVATINGWVLGKTQGEIKDFLDVSKITKDTRTILINALYFKGTWVTKFDEHVTKKKPFFLNHGDHVDVDMMELTDYFKYSEDHKLQAQFLEMPYAGGDVSMVIVLPYNKEGLSKLENDLDEVLANERAYQTKVHVQIPKFKQESQIELNDILQNLGIKDAFQNYADFSGFSAPGELPLKISDVIQKTIIKVDEKGTIAAAATAVLSVVSYSAMAPSPPKEFNADHPFLYYIKTPLGVMFIGRYVSNN